MANIVLKFKRKKPSHGDPGNNRPVSLTSVPVKLLDQAIKH